MATRVKKQQQTAAPKEIASPQTSKNEPPESPGPGKTTGKPQNAGIGKKLGRKTAVKAGAVKKTVQLKAKAKATRKSTLRLNPKSLARVLLENGKAGLEGKKILLKNGGKDVMKRAGRKPKLPKIKKEPQDEEPPPVLEPIFPQEENLEVKKSPKKRGRKPAYKLPGELLDVNKKIKTEPTEEPISTTEDPHIDITESPSPTKVTGKKSGRLKKPKTEPAATTTASSIEEVMTDLSSFLIDTDCIKKELMDDAVSTESINKGDQAKANKKLTKKQRLELIKKDFNKKENIENTLSKLDPADAKVIDQLDLNVRKFKTDLPRVKRRHSIEKCPVGSVDSSGGDGLMPQLSVFNQLPRSLSPKTSKRSLKFGGKRASPYSTRSDSPARMLRNGKHRRLKDMTLLDGLENPKRRKRVHSDLSGSETASKLSGYESDSSFSDLASLHGSEKDSDLSKPVTLMDSLLLMDESSNLEPKVSDPLSDKPIVDTNSNVCDDPSESIEISKVMEKPDEIRGVERDAPSEKMPEKGLLLDIMKQTFNDKSPPKFYGKPCTSGEQGPDELIQVKLKRDSPVCSPEIEKVMSEEDELRLLLEQHDAALMNERKIVGAEEDKEAEEEASFENIVQGCIDSIASNMSPDVVVNLPDQQAVVAVVDEAPLLEKQVLLIQDDTIPVIDNMSAAILEPPQNLEHLEPPLLESSVPSPEPQPSKLPIKPDSKRSSLIDDHAIGIAVTEKDNVVSFTIEHLTEDVEEAETSTEDVVAKADDNDDDVVNKTGDAGDVDETNKEENVDVKVTEEAESVEPPPPVEEDATGGLVVNVKEAVVEEVAEAEGGDEGKMETNQTETEAASAGEEEQLLLTEQGCCDKPSETVTVSKETSEDVKEVEENAVEESAEELMQKENILNALGLQSLRAVKDSSSGESSGYPKKKGKASTSKGGDGYTGTLKTVIKINKKKGKNSFKMTLQKSKTKIEPEHSGGEAEGYKIMKEGGSGAWKHHSKESSDTAGAQRKSHYSNRFNMEGSSEHTSDSEQATVPHDKNQPEKSLIVPEKASSFSIHPGRLCKDECSYCFGKFGLFDTPCHIAQMKSVERQNKILASENHLTRDSCLCDACYRHVDRKSNSPSYINKSLKRNSLVAPGPRQNHCHVLGCSNVSTNILRRKWIIKMRKSICQVINIDLDNPGLHSIPICDEHFSALEHLMICAMCKRRLARNHIHYLGPEVKELNDALSDENIPILLCDKPVVCKLCKCFASIILKDPEERMENSINFFREYKKRLLHFNDIVPMDSAAADEPIVVPGKSEKFGDKADLELGKRKKRVRNSSNETVHSCPDEKDDLDIARTRTRVPSTDTNNSQSAGHSRAQSPDDGDEYGGVDYNTLIPAIAMDCPSDGESKKDVSKKMMIGGFQRKLPKLESFSNAIEISRTYKSSMMDKNRSNDLAAQRLGQNPSISLRPNYGDVWQDEQQPPSKLISNPAISVRQLFPGEEELGLVGDIEFKNVLARTPEGWEKCAATIQYDEETKLLWQELQKPYGSKSSFLRHLILLEKYFRNGDLVLSPSASHHAVNYRESVHNRLRAYDNIPSNAGNVQPPTMVQFNKIQARNTAAIGISTSQSGANALLPPVTISQIKQGDENQSSRTPITLQQLNQPPLFPTSSMLHSLASSKSNNKPSAMPPGLISINQRHPAPATFRPQMPGQKIKFPITKNWRPNLIPIDPSKRNERKPGLVQVISGGKPYHITLEDYKKMCAIKRSFEAKQKKMQEQQLLAKQQQQQQQQQSLLLSHHNSLLKSSVAPKKGLFISKTSGGTVTEGRPISLVPISNASATITSESSETILDKLDKQVERLGQASLSAIALENNPAIQIIPRIPKSLTVIPQTVRKANPLLCLSSKSSSSNGSSNGSDNSNGQP